MNKQIDYENYQKALEGMASALKALKELKPKVLSLFEVLKYAKDEKNIVWLEFKRGSDGSSDWVRLKQGCYMKEDVLSYLIFNYEDEIDDHIAIENYGRTWRCWNKYPTVEQRREIEWISMLGPNA